VRQGSETPHQRGERGKKESKRTRGGGSFIKSYVCPRSQRTIAKKSQAKLGGGPRKICQKLEKDKEK